MTALGSYNHHRHLFIYQGNRSVFHLCCGIALGMYVRYLLEFECTLQSNRIVVTASQVDKVVSICECLGQLGYLPVMLKYLLYLGRNTRQFGNDAFTEFVRYGSLLLGNVECKQQQSLNLSGKGLGRCHTNLGAGMGVTACIGSTCNR